MSPVRFSLVLLLCLVSPAALAWSGVALEFRNTDSNLRFDTDLRAAQVGSITFQIEDGATPDFRVGAYIGYLDLRLDPAPSQAARKFDAQQLGVYLRQTLPLVDWLALQGRIDLELVTGTEVGADVDGSIDWTGTGAEVGLSLRAGALVITPFVGWRQIDGDISDLTGSEFFELDEIRSRGVRLDYYVSDSGFVRLALIDGERRGGLLTFVRRY